MKNVNLTVCLLLLMHALSLASQCPTVFSSNTTATLTTGACDWSYYIDIDVRQGKAPETIAFFQDGCEYSTYQVRNSSLYDASNNLVGYSQSTISQENTVIRGLYDCDSQIFISWEEKAEQITINGQNFSVACTFSDPMTNLVIGYGQIVSPTYIRIIDNQGNEISNAMLINPQSQCATASWQLSSQASGQQLIADPRVLPFVIALGILTNSSLSGCGVAKRATIIGGTIAGAVGGVTLGLCMTWFFCAWHLSKCKRVII